MIYIETIRRVGLQRAYALIRDLEAYRAFARLTPEERGLWEERPRPGRKSSVTVSPLISR
jgi:hypothetical protein